jgi:hypothetical protein
VKNKHACTAQKQRRIAMAEPSHHEVCHTGETCWRCDKHLLLILTPSTGGDSMGE